MWSPLSAMSDNLRSSIRGIFTDIDDTLTNHGKLLPVAYEALSIAQKAGLLVIPITGRPAGWCDHIARMWPVDGVVGENGGFYFCMKDKKLFRRYIFSEAVRSDNRKKLNQIAREILESVPGTALASDQAYREFDLAIDFCEDVTPLPMSEVQRIVALFNTHGAVARISSIHVNGWFGTYDKLTMCKLFMQEQFQTDLEKTQQSFVFCGDSPNDEPMFRFFSQSIGVANIKRFEQLLQSKPRFITAGEGGYGFREVVEFLVGK